MGPLWWHGLLLGAAAILLGNRSEVAAHSLRYFRTVVSKPSADLPRFFAVGFLDDLLFDRYSSRTKQPQRFLYDSWKTEDDLREEWAFRAARREETLFTAILEIQQNFHNQTDGFHTWQCMEGCEMNEDGSSHFYHQDAYDGEPDSKNVVYETYHSKEYYSTSSCLESLRTSFYLLESTLKWRDRPKVRIARKVNYTFCHVYGFYPKNISVTWKKDEKVVEEGTLCSGALPNSDNTYYTWSAIKTDPKFSKFYECFVEHVSLGEPLRTKWIEPAPDTSKSTVLGGLLGTMASALLVAGISIYIRKQQPPSRSAWV